MACNPCSGTKRHTRRATPRRAGRLRSARGTPVSAPAGLFEPAPPEHFHFAAKFGVFLVLKSKSANGEFRAPGGGRQAAAERTDRQRERGKSAERRNAGGAPEDAGDARGE